MEIPTRRRLVLVLTGIFLIQSWMVYSDPLGREAPPLSGLASEGRDLWHAHNCQSCHQLYGFGGFLGPDLTNLVGRVRADVGDESATAAALDARLETVLTTGSERMPAFHLDLEQRQALVAYLTAVDQTGVGQVVLSEAAPPRRVLEQVLLQVSAVEPLGPSEQEGSRIVAESGCIDCHLPNGRSTFRAPDLTVLAETVDAPRLKQVLSEGVPQKGMPGLGLDDSEIAAVRDFLAYLGRHSDRIHSSFEASESSGDTSLLGLPWFLYR